MRNISLLSLHEARKGSLSFGCPIIDDITGGIARGIVTELCGEAGAGKTQICLKLSLQVSR
jgi:RecA/RadA recombinase